jgi:hypothetical protein
MLRLLGEVSGRIGPRIGLSIKDFPGAIAGAGIDAEVAARSIRDYLIRVNDC